MATRTAVPAPDAKIGRKIEFIAKALAPVLQPRGFERQARTWQVLQGEGPQRCHWVINLQGNKWNEGSVGAFYVNLALYWPELSLMQARMPSFAWRLGKVDTIDEANGQVRQRLQAVLTDEHFTRWARLRDLPTHGELRIAASTDLVALADELGQALQTVVLPWMQARSSLRWVAEGMDVPARVGMHSISAACLLDDLGAAQALVDRLQHPGHGREALWDEMMAWVASLGLQPVHKRPPGYA